MKGKFREKLPRIVLWLIAGCIGAVSVLLCFPQTGLPLLSLCHGGFLYLLGLSLPLLYCFVKVLCGQTKWVHRNAHLLALSLFGAALLLAWLYGCEVLPLSPSLFWQIGGVLLAAGICAELAAILRARRDKETQSAERKKASWKS